MADAILTKTRSKARPMKLFVWDNCLTDYTSGIMFAVARDLVGAKRALKKECSYLPEGELDQEPKVYNLKSTVARAVWGGS